VVAYLSSDDLFLCYDNSRNKEKMSSRTDKKSTIFCNTFENGNNSLCNLKIENKFQLVYSRLRKFSCGIYDTVCHSLYSMFLLVKKKTWKLFSCKHYLKWISNVFHPIFLQIFQCYKDCEKVNDHWECGSKFVEIFNNLSI